MVQIKKILATFMLGVVLTLGSQTVNISTTAAQDVWAYSYNDGGSIYVMTETIWYEKYRGYHVTIKDIERNGDYSKVKLFFTQDVGGWWFKDETHPNHHGPMTKIADYPNLEAALNVVLQYVNE